jgi:hypothetical protein
MIFAAIGDVGPFDNASGEGPTSGAFAIRIRIASNSFPVNLNFVVMLLLLPVASFNRICKALMENHTPFNSLGLAHEWLLTELTQ